MPSSNSTSSAPSPPERTPKGVRRACDCCRKRKVRCDGLRPCGPCRKTALQCAYLQAPRKKGPKGLRSQRVLDGLREIYDPLVSPTGSFDGIYEWNLGSGDSSPTLTGEGDEFGLPKVASLPLIGQMNYLPGEGMLPTPVPLASPPYAPYGLSGLAAPTSNPSTPDKSSFPLGGYPGVRFPSESFIPYVELFFEHMYPIMPVLDRKYYIDSGILASHSALPTDQYLLLCALSSMTIMQLETAPQMPLLNGNPGDSEAAAEVFAKECLRERLNSEYVEHPTDRTVLTSFFLFCYYGNLEKSEMAWYYLQESLSFAQSIELDKEHEVAALDFMESQWHRRLFWLLFVTEKAYAIQRRRRTRLQSSIRLPLVYPPEEAHLVSGFVSLVTLFSTVTEDFLNVWLGIRRNSICSSDWLAKTQHSIDATADSTARGNISETQQLDIDISRQWLHVLAWQMGVTNGLVWRRQDPEMSLEYPINLAKEVVSITTRARREVVDSHGIGMEQKLRDIALCLADVLKCTAGDSSATFLQGRQYLSTIMQQLSRIRGKESRYLRPLMSRSDGLLGYSLPPALTATVDVPPQSCKVEDLDENITPTVFVGV
ncbi:MAG: hypothetical protein M1822_005952 [Bathelium mastoideum]|nr:MAG: hypothetical protein M1822_005952 [Bathelium mastoideum]